VPEIIQTAAELTSKIIRELKSLKELQGGLKTVNCQMDLLLVLDLYLSERNKKLTDAVMTEKTDLTLVWKSMQDVIK